MTRHLSYRDNWCHELPVTYDDSARPSVRLLNQLGRERIVTGNVTGRYSTDVTQVTGSNAGSNAGRLSNTTRPLGPHTRSRADYNNNTLLPRDQRSLEVQREEDPSNASLSRDGQGDNDFSLEPPRQGSLREADGRTTG